MTDFQKEGGVAALACAATMVVGLLISVAALQTRALPKTLNYLGLVVSVAALLTVVPALGELGAVFGLGSILWLSALGVVMLRGGMVRP